MKQLDPALFDRLIGEITEERFYRFLKPVADTLAPSQSVPFTRARVIEGLLRDEGVLGRPGISFQRNFEGTGNCVLTLERPAAGKPVWLIAHLDIISYFVEGGDEGRYRLSPFCYHMMHPGQREGVALTFNLDNCAFDISTRGEIVTGTDHSLAFVTPAGEDVRPGQRVCFTSQLDWNRKTGRLAGSLDDAGGAVAQLLAALFLMEYDVNLVLCLTDEEEGVAGMGNQTIGRGGARLLPFLNQPELAIVCDFQEAAAMREGPGPLGIHPGAGACFAEKTSHGRGEITSPYLYELERQLADELAGEGIRLHENIGGYIGRSDGVNAMLRTPNVAILGFLGENRHFEQDVSSANMKDLVDLARSIVCLVLLTKTAVWRSVFHC